MLRRSICVRVFPLVLFVAPALRAQSPVIDDTTTTYTAANVYYPFPSCGSCDLSPSYNNYTTASSFSITKITFSWYNNGISYGTGNNCDGLGTYVAAISTSNNAAGIIATSTNNIYLGCAGMSAVITGTGELDFTGQTIPASFYLDFYSTNGLQDGASIGVYNVEIWQAAGTVAGTIMVTTNLPSAPFTIIGPQGYSGAGTSVTFASAPPGTYTIAFGPVAGYVTPPPQTQTLPTNGTLTFAGIYSAPAFTSANPLAGLPNLIHNWTFAGTGADSVGGNDIFQNSGTPTYVSVSNVYAAARHFEGNSSDADEAHGTIETYDAISFWVKSDASGPTNTSLIFTEPQLNVITIGLDGTVSFTLRVNGVGEMSYSSAPSNAMDGNWHNIILSRDATSTIVSVYIDGNLSGSTGTASSDFAFGNGGKVFGNTANGLDLQDFGFFNAGLSASTVAFINAKPQTGTVVISSSLAYATFSLNSGPATQGPYPVTLNNMPAGSYTVTFSSPTGYLATPLPSQVLTAGGTISFIGQYTFTGPGAGTKSGTASEPINTATGDYFTSHSDIVVPGKGLVFNFTRFYNSLDPYSGPLGVGWTHSFNVFLTVNGTTVSVKEADGHQVAFASGGGGAYTSSTAGEFDILNQNADTTFTLTRTNQTRFNFTSAGQLTTIVDRNGNTQRLTYDGSGNLTSILDSAGRAFTFVHNGTGQLTGLSDPIGRSWQYSYDAKGNLVSVTDAKGGVTQYAYDSNHHMTSATDARGVIYLQNTFDSLGRVVSQANARGFVTTLVYGSPVAGTTTFTDPLGNTTQHTYDANLRLMSVTDAKGGVFSYAYDSNNDRTSVTNQNGKTTAFAYDSNGNTTTITDPLGNIKKFSYDTKNDLMSATNPKGNATSFSYDAAGNLITIKDPFGNTTTFTYNSAGLPISKRDARDNATTLGYDASGNLIQIKDPLGDTTTLSYDAVGRLTSTTDPKSHTSKVAYDLLSRIVTITDALGDQTQFVYDAISNLLRLIDANGHTTTYAYDGTINLSTVTDAAGNVTAYAYDANNNRTGFTNAKGNTTSYGFDQLNRLNRITDALSFVSAYAYDPVGNVVSTTDANGRTNQFLYDGLNRLTNLSYADGSAVAYAYDPDGDRTTMSDSHGITTYFYDALDRLLSVTNPGSTVVRYAYDAVGNRTSLVYPDGKTIAYTYDPLNRLATATDWLSKATTYTYDAVSNLTQTSYPNKTSNSFAYDPANRLIQVVNSALGLPVLTTAYTLDKVGNRTAVTVDGVTTSYAYDVLNELLTAQLGPLKTTWTYDQVGNRIKQVAPLGTTAYTYNADNRILTAGTTTFSFDQNGNLISKASPSSAVAYAYDLANRLVKASGPGVKGSYTYDGDGNRVTQTTAAGIYTYVNDLNAALPAVLSEQGPDGAITYGYGLGLIEEFSSTFNYFYHYDGLGSVVGLSDAKGIPVAAYAYDAWGNTLLTIPDSVGTRNKFHFAGEGLDPGTGLYYLRARYYDPSTSRFLSRDPLSGVPTFPLMRNRYLYAMSNPVRFRDPSGLTTQDLAKSSQWTPTALDFQLPNTVLSPEVAAQGFGTPFCTGQLDCADYFLSGLGLFVEGPVGIALSITTFGIEVRRDSADPNNWSKWASLIIDAGGLAVGLCSEVNVYCKAAEIGLFAADTLSRATPTAPETLPITTPILASPLPQIQIR